MKALLLLSILATTASAQPDMARQNSWNEKDKKEFIQYLRSGEAAPMPGGAVKPVYLPDENKATVVRKAGYLTLDLAADKVFTVAGNGSVLSEGSSLGPRVTYGGHLFSWVRWYTGVQGSRFRQERLDGVQDLVTHMQFPVGIELALVPLGTPQTHYILLRGGVAAHIFDSSTPASQFKTPLIGWQATWNASLGYEWQIPETSLRLHALADSYYALVRRHERARFFGMGLSAGVAYTF